MARNSALSSKLAAGEIKIVEDFVMETPNTKEMNNILNSVKGESKRVLLVTKGFDPAVMKAASNISNVEVLAAKDINTYQLLKGDIILLQEGAVNVVNELCSKYSKN